MSLSSAESSCEKRLLYGEDYKTSFDTDFYVKAIYSGIDIDPNEAPFADFFIPNTARILHDNQERFGNQTALEFGGGPCLWPSFVLAQYVKSIRFCDYAESNLESVRDWIQQKPNAFDWTTCFEHVLEANACPKEKRAEWEARLREALDLGGLSTCDVNDPKCPILSGTLNQYDIIFSSLCLEASCSTTAHFGEVIKRLVRLLKPGGLLLLAMARNESFYYVNEEKFFCLQLNENAVEKALSATGQLEDIRIDSSSTTIDNSKCNKVSDFDGKMIIHAFKTKN